MKQLILVLALACGEFALGSAGCAKKQPLIIGMATTTYTCSDGQTQRIVSSDARCLVTAPPVYANGIEQLREYAKKHGMQFEVKDEFTDPGKEIFCSTIWKQGEIFNSQVAVD